MTDSKNKLENAKDKIMGETKEAAGKVTGNEELELKEKFSPLNRISRKKLGK